MCWVFAACGLPLAGVGGAPLLLWGTWVSGVASHGLQLRCSTWDVPGPGIGPVSPALAGRFFTTELQGSPALGLNWGWMVRLKCGWARESTVTPDSCLLFCQRPVAETKTAWAQEFFRRRFLTDHFLSIKPGHVLFISCCFFFVFFLFPLILFFFFFSDFFLLLKLL